MSCRNAAEANLKTGHSLAGMWQKLGVADWQQKFDEIFIFQTLSTALAALKGPALLADQRAWTQCCPIY
jgi:hypothetical protein